VREMQIFDFKKKIAEAETKLKQQQNLYEAVRSDRNLYSKNLIESQVSHTGSNYTQNPLHTFLHCFPLDGEVAICQVVADLLATWQTILINMNLYSTSYK